LLLVAATSAVLGGLCGWWLARLQSEPGLGNGPPSATRSPSTSSEVEAPSSASQAALARRSRRLDLDDSLARRLLTPVDVESSEEGSDDLVVDTLPASFANRIPIERDADPAIDPLLARIAALEDEVDRLQVSVRDGDPRRRRFQDLLAANKLLHEKLWRDLHELVADPGAFAEDPTRTFPLLLRLIDETGVATLKADEYGTRQMKPELDAEDTSVTFRSSVDQNRDERGTWDSKQIGVDCCVRLPKAPEGWLAAPEPFEIHVTMDRSENGLLRLYLDADDGEQRGALRLHIEWQSDLNYISRSPWRGSEESREMKPGEFPELHAAIDQLFDRLEMRIR
jgi:hypothetical protein